MRRPAGDLDRRRARAEGRRGRHRARGSREPRRRRSPKGRSRTSGTTGSTDHRLVGPRRRARVHGDRRRHRARRRERRRDPGRPGLPGQGVLLPGQRPARPRIAAQGGINATKDYANEGDSVHRLFVDTLKGGDFRAREANVWRLAELSTNIIDQAVAQGVPFNREYGGAAGDPLVRRRARRADLLLPRPDRAAAAARRLQRAAAAGRRGPGRGHHPPRAARHRPRRRAGARDHRPRPRQRRARGPRRRRRRPRDRRLLQRLLPLDQRQGLQRDRDLARPQARRRRWPTPASPRSTRPASRRAASTSRS